VNATATPESEALFHDNEDLVRKVLLDFVGACRRAGEDDLRQEGYLGLLHAARGHDPERGGFRIYARRCIRGQMLGFLTGQRGGRWPSGTRLSGEELEDLAAGEDYEWPEPTGDTARDLEAARQALEDLPEPMRRIVRAHFGFDGPADSLNDIAKDLGHSRQAVWNLGQRALVKIRTAVLQDRRKRA
jgi:RNA polymerase sigma factor (sigma-70 family)